MATRLLERVLERIRPTTAERSTEIKFAQELVRRVAAASPAGCGAVLTGSVAKGTFLRDSLDIDIFVLFPRSHAKEHLEGSIEAIVRKAFPGTGYRLSYAEHPYARFHYQGRKVDLVPAYRIKDAAQRQSAVDRSVLHTKFVLRSMRKKQADDVLLLKAFLKANSLYGAEIKVHGFSGYLCELLIIRYGSFMKLARAAEKWKLPLLVDIKKYYALKEAKALPGRFCSGFIVIDPADRNRNVAAAVSSANLKRFVSACRRFLRNPSQDFFLRKPPGFQERAARAGQGGKLFLLTMPRPDVVDDVLWGQLYKMIDQLERHMEEFGPKAVLADDTQHLIRLAVVLRKDRLAPKMLVQGPPLDMAAHVRSFRKSRKGAKFVVKGKRLCAIVKRPIIGAEDAMMGFFRGLRASKSHLACSEELVLLRRGFPEGA